MGKFKQIAAEVLLQRYYEQQEAGSEVNPSIALGHCAFKYDSLNNFTVVLLWPLVAIALSGFVPLVVFMWKRRQTPNGTSQRQRRPSELDKSGEFHEKTLTQRYMITIIILVHIGYNTMVTSCVNILNCDQYSMTVDGVTSDHGFLSIDHSIPCRSNRYQRYRSLSVLFILAYGCGIPLSFVLVMKFIRKFYGEDIGHTLFIFMMQGYKREQWYWEAWVMVRKMVLAFLLAFNLSPTIQTYLAVWFLSVCLGLNVYIHPYQTNLNNWAENVSLCVLVITLNMGLLFDFLTTGYEVQRLLLTWALLSINILVIILFIILFIRAAGKTLRHWMGTLVRRRRRLSTPSPLQHSSAEEGDEELPDSESEILEGLDGSDAIQTLSTLPIRPDIQVKIDTKGGDSPRSSDGAIPAPDSEAQSSHRDPQMAAALAHDTIAHVDRVIGGEVLHGSGLAMDATSWSRQAAPTHQEHTQKTASLALLERQIAASAAGEVAINAGEPVAVAPSMTNFFRETLEQEPTPNNETATDLMGLLAEKSTVTDVSHRRDRAGQSAIGVTPPHHAQVSNPASTKHVSTLPPPLSPVKPPQSPSKDDQSPTALSSPHTPHDAPPADIGRQPRPLKDLPFPRAFSQQPVHGPIVHSTRPPQSSPSTVIARTPQRRPSDASTDSSKPLGGSVPPSSAGSQRPSSQRSDRNTLTEGLDVTLAGTVERLHTFSEWKRLGCPMSHTVNPSALARAGLCHQPTQDHPDSCVCKACGLLLVGWQLDDIPKEQHMQRSPGCPLWVNAKRAVRKDQPSYRVGKAPSVLTSPSLPPTLLQSHLSPSEVSLRNKPSLPPPPLSAEQWHSSPSEISLRDTPSLPTPPHSGERRHPSPMTIAVSEVSLRDTPSLPGSPETEVALGTNNNFGSQGGGEGRDVTLAGTVERLHTFSEWKRLGCPISHTVNPSALARAGLCHQPTQDHPDSCVCKACGLLLVGWQLDDIPKEQHMQRSPGCPLWVNAKREGHGQQGPVPSSSSHSPTSILARPSLSSPSTNQRPQPSGSITSTTPPRPVTRSALHLLLQDGASANSSIPAEPPALLLPTPGMASGPEHNLPQSEASGARGALGSGPLAHNVSRRPPSAAGARGAGFQPDMYKDY